MKIYKRFKYDTSPEVTNCSHGVSPAYLVEEVSKLDINFYNLFYGEKWWFQSFFGWEKLFTIEEMTCHLVIDEKASLTDFLSIGVLSGFGFIVSEKAKKLIEDVNLPYHRIFPIVLHRKKSKQQVSNYYWWLCYQPYIASSILLDDLIDFPQSEFWASIPSFIDKPTQHINSDLDIPKVVTGIPNSSNFDKMKQKNEVFCGKKIVLKPSFNANLDVTDIPLALTSQFISTELTTILQRENLTGFEIKELPCELIFT